LCLTRLAGGDSAVVAWPLPAVQLAVAFRVNLLPAPRQHVLRRDVAEGTVQADVVVMVRVALVLGDELRALSEMIRGRASGYFSLAHCMMISMSASSSPIDPS
jgi:hypothetical protein